MFQFQNEWFDAIEQFFVAWVSITEISTSNWTPIERELTVKHRWWSVAKIVASEAVFAPRRLAEFLSPPNRRVAANYTDRRGSLIGRLNTPADGAGHGSTSA